MRALSVQQPWASLIVGGPSSPGVKRTENRSRSMATFARKLVGETIAIHASKKPDANAMEDLLLGDFGFGLRPDEVPHPIRAFPLGAVVGVATIDRVFGPGEQLTEDEARFYVGNDLLQDGETFGIAFRSRRWLDPIACAGALGFWHLPATIEQSVRLQLEERAA